MSDDQSMFDRAKEQAGGLKHKLDEVLDGDDERADRPTDETDETGEAGEAGEDTTGGRFGEQVESAQDTPRNAAERMPGEEDPEDPSGQQPPL